MRQLIIDIETTGFSTTKGDRIVEFCALEMIDNKLTGNKLHLYFNPEREISEENSKIHGLTMDHLQDKPKFADHAEEIYQYLIHADRLVAHNAPFDTKFLNFELTNVLGLVNIDDNVIDTLQIAKKIPNIKHNLTALCEYYGTEDNREHHGALADCELLAQVYLKLIGISNAIN